MVTKKELNIDDNFVDEIVDEVMSEISTKTQPTRPVQVQTYPSGVSNQFVSRLERLEQIVQKYVHSYKVNSVEIERQLTEKTTELTGQQDKQIMRLQEQVDELRNAVIRLGSELRKIRESTGQK